MSLSGVQATATQRKMEIKGNPSKRVKKSKREGTSVRSHSGSNTSTATRSAHNTGNFPGSVSTEVQPGKSSEIIGELNRLFL